MLSWLYVSSLVLCLLYTCSAILGILVRYFARRTAVSAGIYASSKGQTASDSNTGKARSGSVFSKTNDVLNAVITSGRRPSLLGSSTWLP